MLQIENTQFADLQQIFELFEHSVAYQESRGYPSWRNYDKDAIRKDIGDKRQYKGIIESKIAIVFSVSYADKIIWRELDEGKSIYLHRIVVNPEFKGRKLCGAILKWAIQHSMQLGLESVRMDKWTTNPTIIEYYKGFGFNFVENYITPDSPELPVHNRNLALTLLEYKVPQSDITIQRTTKVV